MAILEDYLDSFPGQLVTWILDEIRKDDMASTAWENQEDEDRQARLDAMGERADQICARMIATIQAQGQDTVKGVIESVTFKKGVKVVVDCAKTDPNILDIAHEAGGPVMLLLPQRALDLTVEPSTEALPGMGGDPEWTPPADEDDDRPENVGND